MRCCIASEFVRHEAPWLTALALEKFTKELFRGAPIAPRLNQDVDEIAVLVDCTPQILTPAADGDKDLVKVPNVAKSTLPLLELRSITGAELRAPLTDRFVGDHNSALGQQIFDIAEA